MIKLYVRVNGSRHIIGSIDEEGTHRWSRAHMYTRGTLTHASGYRSFPNSKPFTFLEEVKDVDEALEYIKMYCMLEGI